MRKTLLFSLVLAFAASPSEAATVTINDASGQIWSYENLDTQSPELHILGIYETTAPHHTQGNATVHVNYGGDVPIVLLLSSYEPVLWDLDIEAGVNIDKVLLNGYYDQDASGIDASLVDNHSDHHNWFGAYGYSLPNNGGGGWTENLISVVESYTGLTTTTFTGTYRAEDFTLVTSEVPAPATGTLLVSFLSVLSCYGCSRRLRSRSSRLACSTSR